MRLDALHRGDDGAALLDDVAEYVRRFVAFPSEHARVATVLWVGHAHAVDAFESTPRLAPLSPEPGSGKSRLLEVLGPLVPHPMHAVNATPAALFRAVSDLEHRPTILFDEIDTVFGPKAKENEEVRGFLNAGHRRGAVAYRCVGEGTRQKVTAFPAFCAVAVAGLHDLPDTIATRSVIIRMRRRAPHEHVEPFRFRRHEPEGYALRDRLAAWAAQQLDALREADPDMPAGVTDRPADVWEPLLAVADAAGGDWPARARPACQALAGAGNAAEPSLGVRLLADLRAVWADLGDPEAAHTADLLDRLRGIEEAPWSDLRGRPLDARGLARYLGRYGIARTSVKVADRAAKGYRRAELWDAWSRYLPPPPASPGQGSPRSPRSPEPPAPHPGALFGDPGDPGDPPPDEETGPADHDCAGMFCQHPGCPHGVRREAGRPGSSAGVTDVTDPPPASVGARRLCDRCGQRPARLGGIRCPDCYGQPEEAAS